VSNYLILVQLAVLVFLFAFALECDDDKTDKNVDHEERDDDDVDEVEDSDHLAVVVYRAKSLTIRVNARVQQTITGRKHEKHVSRSVLCHTVTPRCIFKAQMQMHFLVQNSAIHPEQHDFFRGKSTCTNLLENLNDIFYSV